MDVRKVRILNDRLWDIVQEGHDIDEWLKENVGSGNYTEWFGITNLPYRSFSFRKEKDELLFIMRWL